MRHDEVGVDAQGDCTASEPLDTPFGNAGAPATSR